MISASEERVTMYSAEIIVKQMNELKARFCGCMALFCWEESCFNMEGPSALY